MTNPRLEYLQIFDKRVFFDIASNGCGSNCAYCFTKNPGLPQELLSMDTVIELCKFVRNMKNCSENIISLCPNTEPLKSEQSRLLVEYIVKELCEYVKYIQISTKEFIPIEFLHTLDQYSSMPGKIRISISLPYLRFTDKIEPGAADIDNRLKNFLNIKRFPGIASIMYLRPFNQQMIIDKDLYIDAINAYKPDDICLGAEFVPRVEGRQLCTFMYDNELAPEIFRRADLDDIFVFAEDIRKETGQKVFFSSLCNIANRSNYGCMLELYKYDKRYCVDCVLKKPCN